ncbi:MAG: HAD hydrolase-like protein [Bacteroidia bacterium]|nr:HAD hydrolase-like protein [Bacteroidia bacterium]
MNIKIVQFISAVSGTSAIIFSLYSFDRDRIVIFILALIIGILLILLPKIIDFINKNILKIKKQSEKEFYSSLDFSEISTMYVIGHTGKEIYTHLHFQLERLIREGKDIPKEIFILIRSPYIEGSFRNDYIRDTINKIISLKQDFTCKQNGKYSNIKIDIRYYEALPSIRGVLCLLKNNDKICFFSSYYWSDYRTSKAFDFGYRIYHKSKNKDKSINFIESWFNYFWGNDEIHTIVFDFDATLVDSINIQIKAWIEVLKQQIYTGDIELDNLSDEIRKIINSEEELIKYFKKIFISKQHADIIIKEIFINLDESKLIEINKKRYDLREKLIFDAKFFDGAIATLTVLSKKFNLAIVSSTGERMINTFLSEYENKENIRNMFSIILGKFDPILLLKHQNIEHKAFLLQKISSLTGIPLSRIVLIGDNNSDYLAAKQLGVDFIECRASAKNLGIDSFIDKKIIEDHSSHLFFTYYNELSQKLDIVSKNKKNRKYNYYQTANNTGS